jgi:GH24 family phage-related lysozyme (muramidase)
MDLRLMSDVSSATDYAGYLRDVQNLVLRARQLVGAAPDTLGVTVPTESAQSAEQLSSMQRSWRDEMVKRKGAGGYDMADTPHEASYLQRRYDFIAGEEAVRKVAYDDATGRPVTGGQKRGNVTVGVGFNMDRPDAPTVMERALGFTKQAFEAVYSGQRALSELEIRKLFDYNVREAEDVVQKKVGDVPLPEHKRIALVSMAFNSPKLIGEKIVGAIKSQDWKSALNEILFNSNARGHRGLAARRYKEAVMFNGPADAEAALPRVPRLPVAGHRQHASGLERRRRHQHQQGGKPESGQPRTAQWRSPRQSTLLRDHG